MSARRTGSLLTLATLSVVATLGFARLFNDASWVLPVFLAAVGAHGVGLASRRWLVSLSFAVSAVVMSLLLCAVVAGHTTFYGLPTGSTLSALARRFYGDAAKWPRIHEANRDQVLNPDRIFPGQVLRIPQKGGSTRGPG